MLPHLVYDDQYAYAYKHHGNDPHQFVILDNGAAESEDVPLWTLCELVEEFCVDEVVIPDTIGNMLDTIEKAEYFIDMALHELPYRIRGVLESTAFMFVVQGQTMDEFRQSAAFAIEEVAIDTIGIPRHMLVMENGGDGTNRYRLAQWIAERTDKPIHLLGGNPKFPCEIRDNGHWPESVRSTDTSSPFNFAFYNKKLRHGNDCKRPDGYFDLPAEAFEPGTLTYNIRKLKEWTGDV
jgi:hypothetical protein